MWYLRQDSFAYCRAEPGCHSGVKCETLYYDIYTSDLAKICRDDEFVMFADDTCLVYAGDDLSSLTDQVNERLAVVFDWCCYNKLSLNPSKCSYMFFTNKIVIDDPVICLDSNHINRAKEFKYLGIYLDDGLKYHKQLDFLCGKMARLCGVSYRLKRHLDIRSAKKVYFSCIYSVITYCLCIWGGVLQCTERGQRIIKLHERAVKNLFSEFCHPEVCIFKCMKLLKLKDIHKLYVGVYMFNVIQIYLHVCE